MMRRWRWRLFWQTQRSAWRLLWIKPVKLIEELQMPEGMLTDEEAQAFLDAIEET